MKVVTVVGARPQFIKAAVVSKILRKNIRKSFKDGHAAEKIVQLLEDKLEQGE